jgi:Hypothetical glycosyl hydrolase family 15
MVAVGLLLGTASANGATSAAGHLRYAIDSWAKFNDLIRTAQRHDYVILHAWQQAKMQEIKAADPTTKVLVYKNLTSSKVTTNPSGFSAHGVPYEEADREHSEWFLLNTSGERFTFRSYPSSWAMDVGSHSYQRRWADNVVAESAIQTAPTGASSRTGSWSSTRRPANTPRTCPGRTAAPAEAA